MNEQLFIYRGFGSSKVLVNDPEESLKYATGLRWSHIWPKGFVGGSTMVRRPVLRQWAIKEAQQVLILDGLTIVYQGRLELKTEELRGDDESVQCEFSGLYTVLAQRRMRKRWADRTISRFKPGPGSSPGKHGTGSQNFSFEANDDSFTIGCAAGADRYQSPDDFFNVEYEMPAGRLITQISFDWQIENDGEGLFIKVYTVVDTTLHSVTFQDTDATGSYSLNLSTPSNKIQIRVYTNDHDYDTEDRVTISNLLIRGMGTAAITAQDIIEDVLTELAGDEISSDFGQIGDPALTLTSFVSDNDGFEAGDTIIQRANGYSDSEQRVWGLAIEDEFGTSDGKARAVNGYRDTSTYKWVLSLADCESFSLSPAMDHVFNNVVVRFTENGIVKYRTYLENANLKDQDSIDRYGRRDSPELDVGESTAAQADSYGERFLNYSKNPLNQAHFATRLIKNKAGIYIPTNRVRSGPGHQVKLLDNGVIYFCRQVDYDADTGLVTIYPDLPPNQLEVQLIQRTLKVK